MQSCGFLGLLNVEHGQTVSLMYFHAIVLGVGVFHFGYGGYQMRNEWEFGELVEAFHSAIINFTGFCVYLIVVKQRNNSFYLFHKILDGIYQYPWGPWKEETALRYKGEQTVRYLCLGYPAIFLNGRILEYVRHFWTQNRQPYEPYFKGWVPYNEDTIYTLICVTIFHGVVFVCFFFTASCICTFFGVTCERFLTEVEVLKLVLRDPHFIVENQGVSFNEVIKCCIKHHNAINKYFRLLRQVFEGMLIAFFINMTFLFAAVALLITDSKASAGMKIIFVCADLVPELASGLIACWYGQKIIDSTGDLCNTIYQMRWYDLKPQDRKQLVTIMIRTQDPMTLSGGGIKVFNLEAYTEMLSTAYSYTNMLGAIKQP